MAIPRLTLVGAGPGDPDLITVKGMRALASADAVLYDALANPVLLEYVRPGVPRIDVGKRRDGVSFTQERINELIVECATLHGHVVRLKGGDPFVFGRGFEELEYAMQFDIPGEYVPGISSAVAVPGLAGIPLTHRGVSRSFWTISAVTSSGELSPDIAVAACLDTTVVILMGAARLDEIIEIFLVHGRYTTPAAIIQNGSFPNERRVTGTLETIVARAREQRIDSPAVIVIGEVVGLVSRIGGG